MLLVDLLETGPLCVSLLAPAIVVVFALAGDGPFDPQTHALWLLGLYVGMVIAVAAVFDFPSVRNLAFALTPPLLGILMMFGAMGWLRIHLNPANIIVLPLILGIGVDNGVYVLHDFRQRTSGYRMSSSTTNAITLTSLTSMIGFGSMLVASHRGLGSLGLVLVLGLATSLFVSLVVLPSLLTCVAGRLPATETHLLPALEAASRSEYGAELPLSDGVAGTLLLQAREARPAQQMQPMRRAA